MNFGHSDAVQSILNELGDALEEDEDFEPLPTPAPFFETGSARAARERREAAERQRRCRIRRKGREMSLEQREADLVEREAALAARELDVGIVDALRVMLQAPATAAHLRTPEGLRSARLSVHNVLGEAILNLTSDGCMDRATAVRAINDRLFR